MATGTHLSVDVAALEMVERVWERAQPCMTRHAPGPRRDRWTKIAAFLPGRTHNAIKNHWNSHLHRIAQEKTEGAILGAADNLNEQVRQIRRGRPPRRSFLWRPDTAASVLHRARASESNLNVSLNLPKSEPSRGADGRVEKKAGRKDRVSPVPASPCDTPWAQEGALYTPLSLDAHVRHSRMLSRLLEHGRMGGAAHNGASGAHVSQATLGAQLQRGAVEETDLAASQLLRMLRRGHDTHLPPAWAPASDAASDSGPEESADEASDSEALADSDLRVEDEAVHEASPAASGFEGKDEDMEMSAADVLLSLASGRATRASGTPHASASESPPLHSLLHSRPVTMPPSSVAAWRDLWLQASMFQQCQQQQQRVHVRLMQLQPSSSHLQMQFAQLQPSALLPKLLPVCPHKQAGQRPGLEPPARGLGPLRPDTAGFAPRATATGPGSRNASAFGTITMRECVLLQ